MKNIGMSFQKNVLTKSAVIGLLSVLAFSSFILISASAATYPVTTKLNPTSSSYARGQTPSETLILKNNGAKTFDAKTCNLKYTGPFTGTKSAVCPTNFTPFAVLAGQTIKHHYASFPFRIPLKAPLGTYNFMVIIGGTVGGSPFDAMIGTFSITVT
jgi:hypothetical protein